MLAVLGLSFQCHICGFLRRSGRSGSKGAVFVCWLAVHATDEHLGWFVGVDDDPRRILLLGEPRGVLRSA